MTALTLRTPSLMGRTAFEQIFDQVFGDQRNMIKQSTSGYPITDIYKDENNNQVIEMALAGFSKDDIEVEVAENTLSVRSDKKAEPEDEYTYHRGISYRKFDRKFTLADDIVVTGANLENGLLRIDLERIVPEEKKPRLIEVK